MQIVIDIPDNEYILVKNLDDFHINRDNIVSYVRKGTVLPKDATNGDMIRALFPDGSQVKGASIYVMNDNKSNIFYNFDWWNAPYKEVKQCN